jgi:hypothetical protein
LKLSLSSKGLVEIKQRMALSEKEAGKEKKIHLGYFNGEK